MSRPGYKVNPTSDRQAINVSRAVYDRLIEIKDQRQRELQRQYSITEVIEQLLEKAARDGA